MSANLSGVYRFIRHHDVPAGECPVVLATTWELVHEPLGAWLLERWDDERAYHYRLDGSERASMTITRILA